LIQVKLAPVSEVLDSTVLIEEYAAECSIPAIGEINPQRDIYALIEKSGISQSFMVSEDEKDIGFAILLMPILPHYGNKVANLECIFIAKSRRRTGAGLDLMREVERYAQQAGCVGILYSSPAGGQLEKLLDASKGYQRTNVIFYRRFA
jgi:hypothetical protein